MFYVYVLLSLKDGKLFIGQTQDLRLRFTRHSSGFVNATKHRRPLKLIYYEAYMFRTEAENRERFLKGGHGREQLKQQLFLTFSKFHYQFR